MPILNYTLTSCIRVVLELRIPMVYIALCCPILTIVIVLPITIVCICVCILCNPLLPLHITPFLFVTKPYRMQPQTPHYSIVLLNSNIQALLMYANVIVCIRIH